MGETVLGQNDYLAYVLREFAEQGITDYRFQNGRGKHDKLVWSHHGRDGLLTIAKTPSDHRAALNLRADLRRQLREAHVTPLQKPQKQGHLRIVSNKSPTEVMEKKLSSLSDDVSVITDILLDLVPEIGRFNKMAAQTAADIHGSSLKFRLQAEVPPPLIGPLLAYLVENGVAMAAVRIRPITDGTEVTPKASTIPSAELPLPVEPTRPAEPPVEEAAVTQPAPEEVVPSARAKEPPAAKAHKRFEGSASQKLMQHLALGPQTLTQLRIAGFTGCASSGISPLLYQLKIKDWVERNADATWALTSEGWRILLGGMPTKKKTL
jgi:hypothetical protein